MKPTASTVQNKARSASINRALLAIVEVGELTGSVTIHFNRGEPRSAEVRSIHSDADGWGLTTLSPSSA